MDLVEQGTEERHRGYAILVYCCDVLGLGHLRRNTAIASALVRDHPGSNALLLTNLSTGDFFECAPGVDFVKLPSLRKDASGGLVPRNLRLDRASLVLLRGAIIDEVARRFRPDLLLVDHHPSGLQGELLPTLRRMRSTSPAPGIVLGLRDFLDAPSVIRRRWQRLDAYQAVERLYDAVLIYGSREVFDTAARYGLDSSLRTEISYCGYVCARSETSPTPTRRELGLSDGKLIVITVGGGADGHSTLQLCLDALQHVRPRADCEAVCITGPFVTREQLNELRARSAGLPVRVLWRVEWAPDYFGTADLIVAMAGYNTLLEAVRLGKQTLVLPRTGPSSEQRLRAELFSRLGVVRTVGAKDRTPRRLACLIERHLDTNAPSATLPGMDGLDRVVRRLQALLAARESARRVMMGATGRRRADGRTG